MGGRRFGTGGRSLIGGAAAALLVVGVAGCGGGSGGSDADVSKDATVTDCYLAAGVLHTARVEVTNTADEAVGFRMRVRFESPDGKTVYGRSPSLDVDAVDAGETTRPYRFVIETEGEDPSKTMECKPEVTRKAT